MHGEILLSVSVFIAAQWLIGHQLIDHYFNRKAEMVDHIIKQQKEGEFNA
jgi:hypothetical protein